METVKVKEGEEFQIIREPGNRVLYSGIAESDEEAEQVLESIAMHVRVNLNTIFPITLKIKKL